MYGTSAGCGAEDDGVVVRLHRRVFSSKPEWQSRREMTSSHAYATVAASHFVSLRIIVAPATDAYARAVNPSDIQESTEQMSCEAALILSFIQIT